MSSHSSSKHTNSSIDKKKLKNILGKAHIIITDYYLMEGDCTMIKCFLAKTFEFLLIYIPSKFRFPLEVSSDKNVYELSPLEETTDCDDYSKTGKRPDIDAIDGEKSVNIYTELTRKYHQKNMTMDDDDEPIERKIKRQVSRLKIPFSNLRYDLAIQNGKILCVSFGDDINIFSIKGYSGKELNMMYVVNLKDFIEKVEEISDQIIIIKKQFYKIIEKISISNMDGITHGSIQIFDKKLNSKILEKVSLYQGYIDEYIELYDKAIEKEDEIVKKYKDLITRSVGDNIQRHSLEMSAHKELAAGFKVKSEIIDSGIKIVSNLQKNYLRWEECGFDSLLMLTRVQTNFERLEKYFS
jgi:hypothetical protein